jgi:hypothetical protein
MPRIEVYINGYKAKCYDVSASFLPQDPSLSWEARARERERIVTQLLKIFIETMSPGIEDVYTDVEYFFVQESKADPSRDLENSIDEVIKIKRIT